MAKRQGRTRAQRTSAIRAKWAAHVAAWRRGGGRQTDYCRAHELDAKYFGLWKGRLARSAAIIPGMSVSSAPALVPVVVRADHTARNVIQADRVSVEEALGVHVALPNGIALEFRLLSSRSLSPLLTELARLSC